MKCWCCRKVADDEISWTGTVDIKERDYWSNQLDFLLSCIGFAVGLGNVWRFPYLCYVNGGGAFLIPYLLMLLMCGVPLFYLELVLGQYLGRGPNVIFKRLCPGFSGIGYSMLFISLFVSLYYNLIIAWSLYYLYASFDKELRWSSCNNEWNTPACFTHRNSSNSTLQGTNVSSMSPSEEYFKYHVLGISASVEEVGGLRWQLVLVWFLAWLITGMCLINGIKSSGKVVYFTAIFPFVVLFAMLIRGATLEGSSEGISFFIIPKWNQLSNAKAWGDAATQICYSLGLGFGSLTTLSSYNRFHHNCHKDAIIVSLTNSGTSIFAGFVIFSIVGFMARNAHVPVDKVVETGPSLAFIAYPEAVSHMALPNLWAVLFFLMLITLGLDSQFAMCETLTTAAYDQWPQLRRRGKWIVLSTCTSFFLAGLPFCTRSGMYFFVLIDTYVSKWAILLITLLEPIIVAWIYGISKFTKNIEEMMSIKTNIYFIVCWKYVSPLTLILVLIFVMVDHQPMNFGAYIFPQWFETLGYTIGVASVSAIPIVLIRQLYLAKKKGKSMLYVFKPRGWRPANPPERPIEDVEQQTKDETGEVESREEELPSPAVQSETQN